MRLKNEQKVIEVKKGKRRKKKSYERKITRTRIIIRMKLTVLDR